MTFTLSLNGRPNASEWIWVNPIEVSGSSWHHTFAPQVYGAVHRLYTLCVWAQHLQTSSDFLISCFRGSNSNASAFGTEKIIHTMDSFSIFSFLRIAHLKAVSKLKAGSNTGTNHDKPIPWKDTWYFHSAMHLEAIFRLNLPQRAGVHEILRYVQAFAVCSNSMHLGYIGG